MATLIPTRLFVDWSKLDPVVETFASELTIHLGSQTDDFALCRGALESNGDLRTVSQTCQSLLDFKEQGHMDTAERLTRRPACYILGSVSTLSVHGDYYCFYLYAHVTILHVSLRDIAVCSSYSQI